MITLLTILEINLCSYIVSFNLICLDWNSSNTIVDWLFDSQGNLRDISKDIDTNYELTDSNLNILETGAKNVQIVGNSQENSLNTLLHQKIKLNKKAKLIDLCPKMKPIEPKPFFYDLAIDKFKNKR